MEYKTSVGDRRRRRNYRNRNKEKLIEKVRHWREKNKKITLQHYGDGKLECVLCGERRLPTLSIDHIDGGGTQHRKKILKKGSNIYVWLRKQNFPPGYRTLCMNCQFMEKERLKINPNKERK